MYSFNNWLLDLGRNKTPSLGACHKSRLRKNVFSSLKTWNFKRLTRELPLDVSQPFVSKIVTPPRMTYHWDDWRLGTVQQAIWTCVVYVLRPDTAIWCTKLNHSYLWTVTTASEIQQTTIRQYHIIVPKSSR